MIEAWFDGCCEPRNPGGHAAFGVVIKRDGMMLFEHSGYVGFGDGMSNNVAEYSGLISILKEIKALVTDEPVTIFGDSKLVINQMAGRWGSHGGAYVPYMQVAKELHRNIASKITYTWIPREKNDICDGLSKKVLKDKGIKFRIQPEVA